MIRTTCRLCDSASLDCVIELNPQPLVDSYSDQPNAQPLYPLSLMLCGRCGHMQLSEVVDPALMYSKYLFRTRDYPWLVDHYWDYAERVFAEFAPQNVIEIGSNDGTLLEFFQAKGCSVLGIDPSNVPASVKTLKEYFKNPLAITLGKTADLIIANHVFAHIDDLSEVVRGIARMLKPSGIFIFEAAYGLDLLQKHYFDTIYHEHLDYHTVAPLDSFFWREGLQLFRVERNDAKGGSVRGFVCPLGQREVELSVALVMSIEEAAGARKPMIFEAFNGRLAQRRKTVAGLLGDEHAIGYGASAGPITTMYQLGLANRMKWLVDDSPRRQGLYAPHSNLPVRKPESLYAIKERDLLMPEGKCILLAWRYAEQIKLRHKNVEFIVP